MANRRLLATVLLLASARPGAGQLASLYADSLLSPSGTQGSSPQSFAVVGGRALFRAIDGPSSYLYTTDGTDIGTEKLVDLCAAGAPSPASALANLGHVLIWASNPCHEPSDDAATLWRTDGTRPGTYPLGGPAAQLRIRLDERGRPLPGLVLGDDFLFFALAAEGSGLWRSDGTDPGTVLLREMAFGRFLGAVTGKALFQVPAASGGTHWWTTDGTGAGTVDLGPEPTSSQGALVAPTTAGQKLFFFVDSFASLDLWVSDGTLAGSRSLASFPALESLTLQPWLLAAGNRVYFVVDDGLHSYELWVSDGTAGGTRPVSDFGEFEPFPSRVDASRFGVVPGTSRLVFWATADGAAELYRTDGTLGSTRKLLPGCGTDCPRFSNGSGFVPLGSRLAFAATTSARGTELWTTDGSTGGTTIPFETCPGSCSSNPRLLATQAGSLYLASYEEAAGEEVWSLDGTATAQRWTQLGPPHPFPTTGFLAQEPALARLGSRIVFRAGGGDGGLELWASEGPPASTRLVTDLNHPAAGSLPREIARLGERTIYTVCNQGLRELWTSDGTPAGTLRLPVTALGNSCFSPGFEFTSFDFTIAGGYLYFRPNESYYHLWRTDGTPAGTIPLLESFSSDFLGWLTELGGQLYFIRYFGDRADIWTSDGTPAGTRVAFPFPEPSTVYLYNLARDGERLVFTSSQATNKLWESDGTAAGTRVIADLGELDLVGCEPGLATTSTATYFAAESTDCLRSYSLYRLDGSTAELIATVSLPSRLTGSRYLPLGNALLFVDEELAGRPALRLTDGTAAGTRTLASFVHQLDDVSPVGQLTRLGNQVFFTADDGAHGVELWTTDGTSAGTRLVVDLVPGPAGSAPGSLTVAAGRLYFAATHQDFGRELWVTDGTAAGTHLVHDINPGAGSAEVGELAALADGLYFSADDGLRGQELWRLPLAGPPCQPSPTALCLKDGRFRVEMRFKDFQERTGDGQAVPLSADTGTFYFFNPANVEAILKVLDGRGVNQHFWTFYGALSNVEYSLTVTDSATGAARRYFNPAARFASVGDTFSFGPQSAGIDLREEATAEAPLTHGRRHHDARAATGSCAPDSSRLCLAGGRFAVEATWRDFQGRTGVGQAVELSGDTGYFWFFDPANVETVIKVLDGTPINGHHWVFYGALSNVEYTLTVTDTATGTVRTYHNPLRRFASVGDTLAF